MKNLYIILAALLTTMTFYASSQNIGDLNGIYYQAVAIDENGKEIVGKDVEGKPLYNKTIGVRFTITSGLNGPVQWEETHTTNTDKYGLFTLTIGQGQPSGNAAYNHMLDIPWIDANQFLKVEISTKNDGNYKMVSNHQFMAAPYSFYTDDIADDAITTAKILDFAILNEDVSTGAVDSRTILDETVLNEDVATGSIDSRTILDETVLNEDVATGSIDSRTILDQTVLNEDVATGSIDSRTILDETVLNEDVATGSIDSRTILDETVLNEDVATGSIDSRTILDETVLNEDVATGSIDSRTILDETVLNEDVATGSIDSRTILDETILNEDVATGSIDSRTILDGSLLNEDIANATIDLTAKVTNILPVANGGTGVSTTTVTDGQMLIGDGANGNFQVSNLTAGTGIEITNTAGGITISSPPVSTETNSDGTFEIPVGSSGTITAGSAWYSPNSLKVTPPVDKPFAMGDIFLASANVDLQGCILSVYLESIDGDGKANVQVVLYNPQGNNVTLQTPVTFKFLVVK